ncbi:FKBP-type peptidyl-prolyl cis-trans isomerase [Polaribacter sp. SA4-10]|uniref:FKBP-type peptidyl-prolyl cis-trans isomerase n=1 Tax=Polaribacter sp. SA4-10 TaxID=754397 RepID=UPI001E5803B5|nr:FKBP-type peptidyl-prolyl cis-trans isomerase [Polaribacter sp. SA4-10]
MYYIINKEGTRTRPTNTNNVTVAYKGYFFNGTVFDESASNGVDLVLIKEL